MNPIRLLFEFENKYCFLYDFSVNGVPIYVGLREGVLRRLQNGATMDASEYIEEKGKIFFKRIVHSFFKIYKSSSAKTVIFTSSMFRRDKGRNLAAEYLMEKYPDAVVFEWPSRNEAYDTAYFLDKMKEQYCPLEYYIILYKFYIKICRKQYKKMYQECEERIRDAFKKRENEITQHEQAAIDYLLKELPESYAATKMSQKIFAKLFKRYYDVEYAIDFWGSARENIIPVLPSRPQSIELQHGIITKNHPGYIYPAHANRVCVDFFARKMLVYGEKTKKLLINESVFKEACIEVIGNPRIRMYKQNLENAEGLRNLVLFTSQPFEQDGAADNYYNTVIPVLKKIENFMTNDCQWNGYSLGIKLHPRENNGVKELYERELREIAVFDNASQLYELLNNTYLHITVSSTTLYEAALFDVPTVTVRFNNIDAKQNFGFDTWKINEVTDVATLLTRCVEKVEYEKYLHYLKEETIQYM